MSVAKYFLYNSMLYTAPDPTSDSKRPVIPKDVSELIWDFVRPPKNRRLHPLLITTNSKDSKKPNQKELGKELSQYVESLHGEYTLDMKPFKFDRIHMTLLLRGPRLKQSGRYGDDIFVLGLRSAMLLGGHCRLDRCSYQLHDRYANEMVMRVENRVEWYQDLQEIKALKEWKFELPVSEDETKKLTTCDADVPDIYSSRFLSLMSDMMLRSESDNLTPGPKQRSKADMKNPTIQRMDKILQENCNVRRWILQVTDRKSIYDTEDFTKFWPNLFIGVAEPDPYVDKSWDGIDIFKHHVIDSFSHGPEILHEGMTTFFNELESVFEQVGRAVESAVQETSAIVQNMSFSFGPPGFGEL
jgi:hypothetical protein